MNRSRFHLSSALISVFLGTMLGGTSVAQAQMFVCGAPDATEAGAVPLSATSLYSATTPGFDLNTAPEVKDGLCFSDHPFFFSAPMPEGDYRITIVFASTQPAANTVRAESRRLMIEQAVTAPGAPATRIFDVNVRTPRIDGDAQNQITLKPREFGKLDWDGKLTLEFNGEHPSIRSIAIAPLHETTLYLAGDSTVVDQDVEPWTAWGQILPRFFAPGIVIANYAESGETIRGFIDEHRLAKVFSRMQAGDYLFLQFGHNDQKLNAVSLADYKMLLTETIAKTRARGATPVLVTSMNRRSFDGAGKIVNSLSPYTEAVREMAAAQQTALIDLNALSKTLFEAMGPDLSMKAFMHYPANAYPNQTEAISDDTHFNGYGAYELARCVVHGMREAKLPLLEFLRSDAIDFDPARPDPQPYFHLPATPIPPKQRDVMKTPQS
jgi:lysophospholipase L1-like esterase